MAPGIIRLVSSRSGLALAIFLARNLPVGPGYAFAEKIADLVAAQPQAYQVRGVRANQWVVGGGKLSPRDLNDRVRGVFRTIARDTYEVYHYLDDLPSARNLFVLDPSFDQLTRRAAFEQPGIMVAGVHYGSFNICLHWLSRQILKPLVLTVPTLTGPLELEFEIRRRTGMNLVPSSFSGIRQAAQYLKQGGIVLTALDRPVTDGQALPRFFDRPSYVPAHHIHLALKSGVPVVVVANRREQDGRYHIYASPPIEMEHRSDRTDELLCNTEKVLAIAETFIRQCPEQWTMVHPVWPDEGQTD